jgi:hypothetical protein
MKDECTMVNRGFASGGMREKLETYGKLTKLWTG